MGESLSDTVQLTEREPRSMKSGNQVINMRREYSDMATSRLPEMSPTNIVGAKLRHGGQISERAHYYGQLP